MVLSALVVLVLSQPPEAATAPERAPWTYLRKHAVMGVGTELGVGQWAGPFSPSELGPAQSAPSLMLGLDFVPFDSPSWSQRHDSASVLLDGARWANGGFSVGLGFSGRLLLLDDTRFTPYIAYEAGARYVGGVRAGLNGFGLDLVPGVGAQLKLGSSIVRLEAGPHFFSTFRSAPNEWWRARLTIAVPF